MTRRDWWLGVALIVLVLVTGLVVQTIVLAKQIEAAHAPRVVPLASAAMPN